MKPIVSRIQKMEVSPLERFEDKSGSGRNQIYSFILDGIKESTIASLLLGHGFYATADFTQKSLGYNVAIVAHNDWLEVTYDFGLLGLILYLSIFFSLLKATIKSNKQNSRFLLLTLAIFLVRASFSMVFADKESVLFYTIIGLILLEDIRTYELHSSTKENGRIS